MTELKIILCILIANTITVFAYILYKFLKKDMRKGAMIAIFMFLCPVIGPIYILCSNICYEIFYGHIKNNISVAELSFSKKRSEMTLAANLKESENKVPIGEALMICDKQNARRVLLNTLKYDYESYLGVISQAVENEDSEVSHYAASVITDAIANFKTRVKELSAITDKEKYDNKTSIAFQEYIYNFLAHHILAENEQIYYTRIYQDILLETYNADPKEMTGLTYYNIVNLLLEQSQIGEAGEWIHRVQKSELEDIEVYRSCLKFYYTIKDRENFLKVLDKLKKSTLVLDSQLLELVRMYNESDKMSLTSISEIPLM